MNTNNAEEWIKYVQSNDIDFIDFGCKDGKSMDWAVKNIGGTKGLGIDINEKKVATARERGYCVLVKDIEEIPRVQLFKFTVMSHFLEHIPDMNQVSRFAEIACTISKEFVYIKQPYFDSDPYLFRNNLKLFWSDWSLHPNRMTTLEMALLGRDMKERGLIDQYDIYGVGRIESSRDKSVHPLSSNKDQQKYEEDLHGEKLSMDFDFPVYKEAVMIMSKPGSMLRGVDSIHKSASKIYSSRKTMD